MVNLGKRLLQVIVIILTFTSTVFAQPIAHVDRSTIGVDESLTLTVRINKTGSFTTPDLTGIRSNFHIVNTSQSSNHIYKNGASESITEWKITLVPKQIGRLLIPALTVDGKKTQPVEIDVRPSVPVSPDDISPVYLESDVDNTAIFVQQQLIFTLRILQAIELDNMNINEPEFDQTIIKKLSQNTYQRRIKNTPYRVHELRYAIFPQHAGELIIPEVVFSANEAVARRSVFDLPGQGKIIRKMTQQHKIKVKNIPTDFKGNTWLPAKSVELEQTWSTKPNNIHVGESITRNITIKADGLLDSQLPPINIPAIKGAKFYPDVAQTQSTETENGMTSSRTDSMALIPTQEGNLTLPETRLWWWDSNGKKYREAIIPATTINVKPALNSNSTQTLSAIDHSQVATPAAAPLQTRESPALIYWQLSCGLLALAWLFTLFLWLSLKQKNSPAVTPTSISNTEQLSEKQSYKTLATVCHNNQLSNARQAIIVWAQQYWPHLHLQSLQDVEKHCNDTALVNELLLLDTYLYGNQNNNEQWNGENLLSAVSTLKKHNGSQHKTKTTELAPLYPE